MRKITTDTVKAYLSGNKKSNGNTTTDGESLFLHGNLISQKVGCQVWVTLAGWNTPTTRERINGVCECLEFGRPFQQINFESHYNGREISSTDWVNVYTGQVLAKLPI